MVEKIDLFKNRKIKAKEIFTLQEIDKPVAYNFIKKYHYLEDAKFFSMYNYGIFIENNLVGVATFSLPQGTGSSKGWCNFENSDKRIQELSRLCVIPELNGTNATSFLLSNSIKKLKSKNVEIVITLADSTRHVGSIYQVCNFEYFGLTDSKSDFWWYIDESTFKKSPRGTSKEKRGVWINKSQKHRYAFRLNKNLKVNYQKQPYPKQDDTTVLICCNGTLEVEDKRYNEIFSCPLCTGELKLLKKGNFIEKTEELDEW
jgi:hypothetical protein